MALVALVTPASEATPSVKAFKDELCNTFGWPQSTFKCFSATAYGNDLGKAASAAVSAVKAGDVLVAAGTKAAGLLQDAAAANIPIILAFGGEKPKNAGSNMTGLLAGAVAVGKHHMSKLKGAGHDGKKATVMYDPDTKNQATQDVLAALVTANPNLTKLPISPGQVSALAKATLTSGFMLIPNAGYYENSKTIAEAVAGDANVKMAYYPEFEYWHYHKTKGGSGHAKVHGHNIPLTFRMAASWANNLLNKDWDVNSLPDFTDAVTENYE